MDACGDGEVQTAELWGLLCRCIRRYMSLFSAKLCCFRDLRPHLALFAAGATGCSGAPCFSRVVVRERLLSAVVALRNEIR